MLLEAGSTHADGESSGQNLGVREDRYGLSVTTGSDVAFEAYVAAMDLALAFQGGALDLLGGAVAADDGFALGWALLGLQQRAAGDIPGGTANIKRACAFASGLSEREQSHLHVLERFVALDVAGTEAATAGDVASMQAVEVEARQRFREIDDARIARSADDPPYQAEGLTRAATEQRAWVAIDDLGAVIGFAVACWLKAKATSTNSRWYRHTAVVASDVRSSMRCSPGPPLGAAVGDVDHLSRRPLERPVLREARLRGRDGVDARIASRSGPERDVGGQARFSDAPIARGRRKRGRITAGEGHARVP